MRHSFTRRTFAAAASAATLGACLPVHGQTWSLSPKALRAVQTGIAPHLRNRRGGVALLHLTSETLIIPAGEPVLTRMLFKPGSTVKPFLLWQLLRDGQLSERSEHLCRTKLEIAGRHLHCTHATQPVALAPQEALALSCNVFFAHFAGRMQPDSFAQTLRSFGVDARQVYGRACAPATVGTPTIPDEMLLQALGESHVMTTPVAMLGAFARLLAKSAANPSRPESRLLREGMRLCVTQGTGVEAQVPGLAIAGKTGTGSSADRSFLNGWFLSYAPADAPTFAMAAVVENGRGGMEAAPVARAAWSALAENDALA